MTIHVDEDEVYTLILILAMSSLSEGRLALHLLLSALAALSFFFFFFFSSFASSSSYDNDRKQKKSPKNARVKFCANDAETKTRPTLG